jgi:hypothetical protein
MAFCGLLGISAYAAAAEKQRPSDIFDQVAAGDSWTVVKTEPDGDVSRASDHVVSSKPVAAPCEGARMAMPMRKPGIRCLGGSWDAGLF